MKKVEMHIDFACPFSYLGGTKIIKYLEEFGEVDNVRFRSFQLNPNDDNTKPNYLQNGFEASEYKTIDEYRDFFNERIGSVGKTLGLNYDVDSVISKNSRRAHMGLQYATLFGKQSKYFAMVMSGHFEKGEDFYDFEYLNGVLVDLGLDLEDFHSRLDEMDRLVSEDIELAATRGITTVPTFYSEGTILHGTGSKEKFDKLLK